MGTKKLTQGFALSSLFVCMSTSAIELDKSQSTLALIETGCAYGRGAAAVEAAKADGLNQLRLFLQGESSLSLSSSDNELFNDSYSESQRETLVSGISQGLVKANFSQPEIQGDDTCVTVRIAPTASENEDDFGDDVEWSDAPTMSVVVTGEGQHDAQTGLTARQVAEQDAFRRAISQVLGVMVKSGYLQQSYSEMSATSASDDFNLVEVARQSLSMQSQGMITGWSEISQQRLANGTVTVTLDVIVEREQVESRIARLISSLGRPSVYINARLPVVKTTFSTALADMGFNLSSQPAQASIILNVREQEKVTPSGLQLEMAASVVDRAGNQYSSWRNDPTFMTLPNKPGMLNELAAIHLAAEDNQHALKAQLHQAVQKMAMQGGPVRELIFSQKAAGQQGRLYSLLSAIHGVSDVKLKSQSGKVVVQLRSMSDAGDLAQYIEPSLQTHQPGYQSRMTVLNEYQLSVL